MAELVESDAGIEADKVEGQSRKPLKSTGLTTLNKKRCYAYKAEFDVKAKVSQQYTGTIENRLDLTLSTNAEDTVICVNAVLHTIKDKYSTSVSKGSATHNANIWNYPNQTAVKITRPHQEIYNAIQKRKSEILGADKRPLSESNKKQKKR